MNRPLQRPTDLIGGRQIVDRAYQHFILDEAPRCVVGASCVYASCGCFVGFMLTIEDALRLDQLSVTVGQLFSQSISTRRVFSPTSLNAIAIFEHYFLLDDPSTLMILLAGQRIHDTRWSTTNKDPKWFTTLNQMLELYDLRSNLIPD